MSWERGRAMKEGCSVDQGSYCHKLSVEGEIE